MRVMHMNFKIQNWAQTRYKCPQVHILYWKITIRNYSSKMLFSQQNVLIYGRFIMNKLYIWMNKQSLFQMIFCKSDFQMEMKIEQFHL